MSIIITDLCKTFDDNEVLKNVNITLKDNSIYCLMGSSGIGKTTLLRILIGLERADSGSVSGIDTKSISCMFQEDRLIPYLSAIDNVRIVLHGKNNRDEIRNNLLSILPDDSLVLPKRILDGIIEMIYALDKIAPGTANDDTLLYGVEVKFYNMEVEIDNNLETRYKGLYIIGDGSGVTHSLSHASASGVYVARKIIEEM